MLKFWGLQVSLQHVFRPLFFLFDEKIADALAEFSTHITSWPQVLREIRECIRTGIMPVIVATNIEEHKLALRCYMLTGCPVLTKNKPKYYDLEADGFFYIKPNIISPNIVPAQLTRVMHRLSREEREKVPELIDLAKKHTFPKTLQVLRDLEEL